MMKNISLWLPGRPGVGVRGRLTFLKKSEARAPERPGVQSESAWVLTVLEIQKDGRHLLTFLEIEKDGRCGSAQTQRHNASFKNKKPTRLICILIIMSIDAPEVVCLNNNFAHKYVKPADWELIGKLHVLGAEMDQVGVFKF